MDISKLNEVIELLDRVTMDINSVEVKILPEKTGLATDCAQLWSKAYKIKMQFTKMRDTQIETE